MSDLTVKERNLLRWLAREEASQYGECHGPDLEALHAGGFVCTWDAQRAGRPLPTVWPPPTLRHAVSVTEAGYDYIREHGIDIWTLEQK